MCTFPFLTSKGMYQEFSHVVFLVPQSSGYHRFNRWDGLFQHLHRLLSAGSLDHRVSGDVQGYQDVCKGTCPFLLCPFVIAKHLYYIFIIYISLFFKCLSVKWLMSVFIHNVIYTLVLCESHLKEKLVTPLEIMLEQVCLVALKKITVLEMKYLF